MDSLYNGNTVFETRQWKTESPKVEREPFGGNKLISPARRVYCALVQTIKRHRRRRRHRRRSRAVLLSRRTGDKRLMGERNGISFASPRRNLIILPRPSPPFSRRPPSCAIDVLMRFISRVLQLAIVERRHDTTTIIIIFITITV